MICGFKITAEGVKKLCHSVQLRYLNLGSPGVDPLPAAVPAELLLHLPRLESLGSYAKVGEAIALAGEAADNELSLRLRCLRSWTSFCAIIFYLDTFMTKALTSKVSPRWLNFALTSKLSTWTPHLPE